MITEDMDDESIRIPKDIRTTIVRTDRRESTIAKYMTNPVRSTKQLSITPWIAYYLPQALIEDSATDDEIIEAAAESICQLRFAADNIVAKLAINGLELPASIYGSNTPTKPTKTKSEKKPAKPKSPPKPKVEEDDDEDWEFDENDDSFIKTSLMRMNLPNKTT